MTTPEQVEVGLGERGYPVVVGDSWLDALTSHVPLPDRASLAFVVTQDPVVAAGHLAAVETALTGAGLTVHRQVVPDGEAAKDADVLAALWHACAALPLGRDDLVVAVGGGTVADLAGFLAATWNRGVAVLQVPTTLLGQVDAAIGGKTGINLPQGKNLVGAFHQPVGVACDVATLRTLPQRVLVEGLGEVVKTGLIADPVILDRLEATKGTDLATPSLLVDLVTRSVTVKASIVTADEREAGVRAHLNLGHTYGHAVEALTGYRDVLHGEAVAIGTVVALRLGVRLGRTPPAVADRGEAVLEHVGLPTRGPRLDRDEVWTVLARDKKSRGGGVRFVVLDDVAVPTVVTPDRADVDAVLDQLAS